MTIPHRARRGLAIAALAGAALLAATGCDVIFDSRTDGTVLDTTPVEIRIGGGSGDITLITDATVPGLDLRRTVRFRGGVPGSTYQVTGGVLSVSTDCGRDCTASYELRVPPRGSGAGVTVTGGVGSGDIHLTGPGRVDLRVGSGDLTVTDAGGNVTANISSGDVNLDRVAGNVAIDGSSGDVVARGLGGTANIRISSGDITLELTGEHNVTAHTSSGDINARVPANRCQIRVDTGSGDQNVNVTGDPSSPVIVDLSASSGDVNVS